jgi:hypothetical protein
MSIETEYKHISSTPKGRVLRCCPDKQPRTVEAARRSFQAQTENQALKMSIPAEAVERGFDFEPDHPGRPFIERLVQAPESFVFRPQPCAEQPSHKRKRNTASIIPPFGGRSRARPHSFRQGRRRIQALPESEQA